MTNKPDPDLETEFAYLTRYLEGLNKRRTYPLERAHYLILLELEEGPRQVSALAEVLALDDSTVTRQLSKMQEAGWIKKVPNPEDGRSVLIAMSDKGEAKMNEMRMVRKERVALLVESWSQEDVAHFTKMLARVNAELIKRLALHD